MAYGFPFQSPRQMPQPEKSSPPPRIPNNPPSPKIPIPQNTHSKPSQPQPLPQPSAESSPLSALLKQIDGDTLLLLVFIWLAAKESCDRKLLLALCYIML